jgi:hypothetical protein
MLNQLNSRFQSNQKNRTEKLQIQNTELFNIKTEPPKEIVKQPSRNINAFDPLRDDCLTIEIKHHNKHVPRPTEDKGVLTQKEVSFKPQKEIKTSASNKILEKTSDVDTRDKLKEAKMKEKQLQFENYLRTDFPEEVF